MPGKDPRKVAAGQARQRQLRQALGEEGYRAYQRDRHADALVKHPDLARRGAHAANRAQLRAWGIEGYIAQRKKAYTALVERIGATQARQRIARAQEQRRQHRLDHPTHGEQLVREALARLGYDVQLAREPFDYLAYCRDPSAYPSITDRTALAEAHVGRFCCDVLIPAQRVAIEVYGGVHRLTADYDQRREALLRDQGLTLLVFHDTAAAPLDAETVRAALCRQLGVEWRELRESGAVGVQEDAWSVG